jgi:CHAD domain-containing protein
MRVAIRRMRSALRLLAEYYKPKAVRAYSRKLRRVARALGAVRDLDVIIQAFTRYASVPDGELLPGAEAVIGALSKERELARLELIHALDRAEYRRFIEDFSRFLTTEGAGAKSIADDTAPSQVRHVLPTLIYSHLGAVRAFDSTLDEAIELGDQTLLHALRIEFKRLRYAVSMFENVLGTAADGFIEELKKIQDHLGDLQDAHTAGHQLEEYAGSIEGDGAVLLHAYIEHLEAVSERERANFAEVWKRFNSKTVQGMLARAISAL